MFQKRKKDDCAIPILQISASETLCSWARTIVLIRNAQLPITLEFSFLFIVKTNSPSIWDVLNN